VFIKDKQFVESSGEPITAQWATTDTSTLVGAPDPWDPMRKHFERELLFKTINCSRIPVNEVKWRRPWYMRLWNWLRRP
jgi:hypothetical protein